MAYQSLYRKYRPQTFADVVGQGHVTRTLQNALASGRVAHGYLFTGTRGTAKTTVARLLAKALNCEASGKPATEPCNKCGACTSITSGGSIDVIEMDAASHRGVADIEEVRKSVGYGPMELRYKVFIIDEAHQLSSDAKDAFLKTLEEPPDNVVFILATTEPQAIPITIRSRCQQFDFKRGSLADIAARLRYVLDCEGVTYDPGAINLVARGAEGSYRDSLSLLEQVLAFAPTHVSSSDVETVLGALDSEMLRQVTQAVARRDAPTGFALAGELLDSGKEARTLLRTLSLHFRDLLLVSVGGPAVAHELTPEEVGQLQEEARHFTPPQMMRAMEVLNEAQGETRWNNQHRLLVELTFLKLMTLGDGEKAGSGNAPPPSVFATAPIVFGTAAPAPPAPMPRVVAPPVTSAPPAVEETPRPAPTVAAAAPPPPAVVIPLTADAEGEDEEPEGVPAGFFASDEADPEDDYTPPGDDDVPALASDLALGEPDASPLPAIDDELANPSGIEEVEDPLTGDLFGDASPTVPTSPVAVTEPDAAALDSYEPDDADAPDLFDDEPLFEPVAAAPVPVVAAAPAPPEPEPEEEPPHTPEFSLEDVMRAWGEFLRKAGGVSMRTKTLMMSAHPTDVVRDTVEISFRERASYDMMNQPKSNEFVRELLKRCLGAKHLIVHFRLDDNVAPAPARKTTTKKKVERDPIKALDFLEEPGSPGGGKEDDVFGGGGNGKGYAAHEAPSSYTAPPPAPRPEPAPPRRDYSGERGIATYADDAAPASPALATSTAAPGTEARRVAALDVPLVQETLSVFGGEIESVDG
jgi:DNA polymerase-3 subunit gamma/tau